MPKPSGRTTVDAEQDYHGMTAQQMEIDLQRRWTEWRRLGCVRLIHGQGERLRPVLQQWCEEKGIKFEEERGNSGSLLIYPQQSAPKPIASGGLGSMGDALKAAGVTLTPTERKTAQRSNDEQQREQERLRLVRKELERRKKAAAEVEARRKQQDTQLWQAEISRLDEAEKKRSGIKRKDDDDSKPRAPFVATRGRHTPLQEGYWRGELVRIVDTDHQTLKEEKQTGLEKLAPPVMPKTDAKGNIEPQKPIKKFAKPQRDNSADQDLFEAEMRRLEGRD